MTLISRVRSAPPRALIAVVVAVLVLGTALVWVRGADERRIDAACDTWLGQREALRAVLAETEEAVGRAEAEGDRDPSRQFNNLDTTLASLERWEATGPGTHSGLRRDGDASGLERGTESAFRYLNSGVTELHRLIDAGSPAELTDWVPEVRARFQNVDDSCLAAAR